MENKVVVSLNFGEVVISTTAEALKKIDLAKIKKDLTGHTTENDQQ